MILRLGRDDERLPWFLQTQRTELLSFSTSVLPGPLTYTLLYPRLN